MLYEGCITEATGADAGFPGTEERAPLSLENSSLLIKKNKY
jgi:hypothetical protein